MFRMGKKIHPYANLKWKPSGEKPHKLGENKKHMAEVGKTWN